MSIVLVTLIHCFFGKQQYSATALKRMITKLSKFLCLEPYTGRRFHIEMLQTTMTRVMKKSIMMNLIPYL